MRQSGAALLALLLLPALAAGHLAQAGDLSGSARVFTGTSEGEEGEDDVLSQDYSLRWIQPISPFLNLLVSYQSSLFSSRALEGGRYERRSSEPGVQLTYGRETVSALLGFLDRRTSGTNEAETFEVRSLFGQFAWKPRRGPRYSLRVRQATNVADVGVFGRDVDTASVDFDVDYTRRNWSARYSFLDFRLDNASTGYTLDQTRHLLRALYGDQFFGQRVAVSADLLYGRNDQVERAGEGDAVADPLPTLQLLFSLDPTPELGELDPAPAFLVAGEADSADPLAQVGGSNLYRNVGLDLGMTQPVTRLEVTVGSPSDPGLAWRVYHSPDNLTWEPVMAVVARFDLALLRYTLRFPAVTDRYFKVVNVSVNSQREVAVTGMRALVDAGQQQRRDSLSTTQRAYVLTRLWPGERLRGTLSVGYNDVAGSGDELPLRETREITCDSLFQADLTESLEGRIQYFFSDYRRNENPVLRREEQRFAAALVWSPLETADVQLSGSRREERTEGILLRRSDVYSLRGFTELLPDLRLTSEVERAETQDLAAGYDLSSWTWRETLESRPTERWSLGGGFSSGWFQSQGRFSLTRRTVVYARTDWAMTSTISVGGDCSFGREDERETLAQRYSIGWAPGPRLAFSASYIESDAEGRGETSATAANLNYQVSSNLNLFASYTRSGTRQDAQGGDSFSGLPPVEPLPGGGVTRLVTSVEVGFNLVF